MMVVILHTTHPSHTYNTSHQYISIIFKFMPTHWFTLLILLTRFFICNIWWLSFSRLLTHLTQPTLVSIIKYNLIVFHMAPDNIHWIVGMGCTLGIVLDFRTTWTWTFNSDVLKQRKLVNEDWMGLSCFNGKQCDQVNLLSWFYFVKKSIPLMSSSIPNF